ncbi:MAG: UDP-N-acetylmuramoyl-tripeptide--D-alanyl-D-alanine ligase, partial [Lachnospiraceae bacterium]|nr:UDP-N-acetylmuramoyl-tripeptide--D-alanyl-D-alanine ligase [Lachnospiraceae bacterium]
MTVRTIIAVCLAAYAFYLTMRYNMHMFQLNGYKNDEHINWIKKNLRRQWLIIFGGVAGLVRIFLPSVALDILIYLTLIMIILVYRALRRLNNKKKLVFTARVKRMIATTTVVSLLVLFIAGRLGGIKCITGVVMLLVSSQLVMNIVANILNGPVERSISRHFINDAKRILNEASASGLKVIGVTGSYGKTSMKFFLKALLQDRFNVLVTPGNFNTPLGVTITVREHLKPSHEIFICEMGARRVGEIREICDIAHPDHGIITSVGPQHLETFLSIDNIKKTKFELADALPEGGMLFLNGDNELIREQSALYENKVFYRSENEGD